MFGTVLNVFSILVGGIVGLRRRQLLSPSTDASMRVFLGAFTVYYGLRLTWVSLNGSLAQVLKQLAIAIAAMIVGKAIGSLLGLQKFSNRLGQVARKHLETAQDRPTARTSAADGFKTCAALFCAAPLGWLGALQDGLSGYFFPLGVKGVMEGLAMVGFVKMFGAGTMLAALPVLAFQGTISLVTLLVLKPFLTQHQLVDPVNAVGGLLVFSVALVILNLKKIQMADYLPSLVFAPLLAWWLR